MVISISSTSTVAESGVTNPSPTPIMEDIVAYVPPQVGLQKKLNIYHSFLK